MPLDREKYNNVDPISTPSISVDNGIIVGDTVSTSQITNGKILYSLNSRTYIPVGISTVVANSVAYQPTQPINPSIGQIWIDSSSNNTSFDPNIIRRKTFTATGGQTAFIADYSFTDGYEQVFLNGLLLVRNSDYTTVNSIQVNLNVAAVVNDIVEIVAITNLNAVGAAGALTTSNTFTGEQNFTPSSATIVPITINGAFNQTANLINIKNYSGSTLFTINSAGQISSNLTVNGASYFLNGVGINTSSPVNALSVNGDMNLTANQAYTTNLYYSGGAWKYVGNGAGGWMKLPDSSGVFTLASAPNNISGGNATATTTEVLRTDIGGQNFFINNSNGNISPTWIMTNTDNSGATWIKLGVFTAGNFGNELKISLTGHTGFNAAYYQNFEGVIRFKTSNGGSVDANGFAGDGYWYHQGGAYANSGFNAVKIVANAAGIAATNYTVYMSTSSYTYGSIYNVQITPGTTWTPNTTVGTVTDPGVASSSICVLPNIGTANVLISTTALSGTSTTISSIPVGFKQLRLILSGISPSANDRLQLSWNSNSGISSWANWAYAGAATTLNTQTQLNTTSAYLSSTRNVRTSNGTSSWFVDIYDYANPNTAHPGIFGGFYLEGTNYEENINGVVTFNGSGGAMTSLVVKFNGTTTFAGGTAYLYGVR